MTGNARWLALTVLCLGDLMTVLDSTIVNVALPSIRDDLGFSETSLAWVMNAYLLTFGGFLLLAGRLGDLFGARKLFLSGLVLFTVASLACGLSTSQEALIISRGIQGVGGALVAAVALALVMNLFTEPAERAKAMGIFGFVLSGGGAAGVLAGGVLTDLLSWNWIFLVNIPLGIAVVALTLRLVPKVPGQEGAGRLDLAGAGAVTGALVLAVYAIVNGNEAGWLGAQTLGLLAVAIGLFIAFLFVETRVATPLVPLGLFRRRNVSAANGVAVLMAAALFGWFFLSALYMQEVLGYEPLEVGLAYLPSMILWGIASVAISDKLVLRYGFRTPIVVGMGLFFISLLLFARAPVDGNFVIDILPATLFIGLGGGITFNPLLLAAMGDVGPHESGLASGIVNTSFMMGGALGLAVLVSISDARTESLEATESALNALNGGYQLAFLTGAIFAILAAILAFTSVRPEARSTPREGASPG